MNKKSKKAKKAEEALKAAKEEAKAAAEVKAAVHEAADRIEKAKAAIEKARAAAALFSSSSRGTAQGRRVQKRTGKKEWDAIAAQVRLRARRALVYTLAVDAWEA